MVGTGDEGALPAAPLLLCRSEQDEGLQGVSDLSPEASKQEVEGDVRAGGPGARPGKRSAWLFSESGMRSCRYGCKGRKGERSAEKEGGPWERSRKWVRWSRTTRVPGEGRVCPWGTSGGVAEIIDRYHGE